MRYVPWWPLVLTACWSTSPAPSEDVAAEPVDVVVVHVPKRAPAAVDADAERPVDPSTLLPSVRPSGPGGSIPSAVIVSLARPVWKVDEVTTATVEGLALTWSPPVAAAPSWEDDHTLRLLPQTPLAPGVTYTLTLSALPTRDGVVALPTPTVVTLITPEFGLDRVTLAEAPDASPTRTVDLVFTGPVDPASIATGLVLRTPEGRVLPFDTPTMPADNVVRMTLRPPADLRTLVAESEGQVRHAGTGTVAARTTRRVTLGAPGEHVFRVLAVRLLEGGAGHVIDVVCDDDAVGGWNRYSWDEQAEEGWWVSQRCELSPDEVATHVHTWPPLDLVPSPTGTGFRLAGELPRGPVRVRIDAGARTIDGGVLDKPVETELLVDLLSPSVHLLARGRYLPRDGWSSLGVMHRNVDHARLRIRHVPPANLMFWMTATDETATERVSDLVVDTEVAVRLEADASLTSWLSVDDVLADPQPGVYEVTVDAGGASDRSRVVVSDLEIVAKEGTHDGARAWDAWVLGMHDHHPIAGADVRLVRASGAVVDRCTTSTTGTCRVQLPDGDVDPAAPIALLAAKGDELTYLRFDDLRIQTSEAVIQGVSWAQDAGFRASLWTERGVYRPGETVHLAAVLRDAARRAPPTELPVRLDVRDPRGKVFKRLSLHPDATGLITADLALNEVASTGTYEALLVVGETTVGRVRLAVEAFVPERMEVSATTEREDYALQDAPVVEVTARYLFGGSALGSAVEVGCRLEPTTFTPPRNAQLHYGRDSEDQSLHTVDLGRVNAVLDADGKALVTCPPPGDGVSILGPSRLVADVAVFEAGSGRSTHTTASARVHPDTFYVGLDAGDAKAKVGEPVAIEGRIVDWQGAAVSDAVQSVRVELYHLETEWDWTEDEGSGERAYRSIRRPVRDGTLDVAVTGDRFTIQAVPSQPGEGFLVRVLAGHTSSDLELPMDGYRWWWSQDGETDRTPRPVAPTAITVTAADQARVGEAVAVTYDAPFSGRALLTIETDSVLHQTWQEVQAGPNRWSFTLDDFVPNVYVGVLVLKDPHLESPRTFLPDRAWGVTSIAVLPEAHVATLTLDVPDEVRSESPLVIQLDGGKLAAGGHAVVAAVDEGILSLTRYVAPDPLPDLFPRHALEVDTYETIGWNVARTPGGTSRSIGGDADRMPVRISGVEPVSLWSGVVTLDSAGRATVTLDVPDYRGALKVMAVVVTPERTGTAQARVVVRDPLVVQTTLPRVLVHGDRAQIPVFLTNTSGAPQDITVSLTAENVPVGGFAPLDVVPLSFEGEQEARIRLEDGASGTVVFRVRAEAPVGAAALLVRAQAGTLVSTERLVVPLVPDAPSERRTVRLPLTEGTLALADKLVGWVPTTDRTSVWVTANPYAEALTHLRYLAHYPYGCIEQTTSTTRPLLVLDDIVPGVLPEASGKGSLDDMVRSGLERILSMQTASGGFGYWPGATEPTLWGSAYATHLLLDARDAGYDIPTEALDDALSWLDSKVTGTQTQAEVDDFRHSEAYVHYVLARAGHRHTARVRTLLEGLSDTGVETVEARYLLQASLFLSGDHRYEDALRHPDARPLRPVRRNDWSFWSDLRGRGLVLSTFHDLFGPDVDGTAEPLARLVADGLAGHASGWYTTQELVWGITGLGKRVANAGRRATLTLRDGSEVLDATTVTEGGVDRRWNVARASERPELKLSVAAMDAGKLFVLLDTEGVRTDAAWRVGGDGLALTRSFTNAAGEAVDPASLELGTLVFAVTRIENKTSTTVRNIALVDRYPAGWEIENPRLGRGAVLPWMEALTLWEPDHVDVRDDRVEVFGELPGGASRTVVVGLRAVTAGTFTLPPASAEAMYDASVWAATMPGRVDVIGHWEQDWL